MYYDTHTTYLHNIIICIDIAFIWTDLNMQEMRLFF